MQIQNNTNVIYGGFCARLAAYIVDITLVGLVLLTIRFPMWIVSIVSPGNPLTRPLLFEFSLKDILLYLLGVFYFVLMTYYTGSTLGKKLFRIKVIASSQEKLTFFNVIYRETIGRYLSSLMFLGYLLICVDQEKRGFHDILCDTRVVYNLEVTNGTSKYNNSYTNNQDLNINNNNNILASNQSFHSNNSDAFTSNQSFNNESTDNCLNSESSSNMDNTIL